MLPSSDHCLCGIHVHKAARVIAITSFILAVIASVILIVHICLFHREDEPRFNAVYAAFRNLDRYFYFYWVLIIQLLMAVILGIVSILLLIGIAKRDRSFYFPFLMNSVFEVIAWLVTLALFIISAVKVADGGGLYVQDSYRKSCLVIMIVFIVLTSIFAALRAYLCLVVVWQAQDYLKRQASTVVLLPSPRVTVPPVYSCPSSRRAIVPRVYSCTSSSIVSPVYSCPSSPRMIVPPVYSSPICTYPIYSCFYMEIRKTAVLY